MTIQERLKCVTPALATPLKKDGTFDPEGMTKLVKYVMSKGMTNIFVLGYAGEVLAFSREERKAIIKTCLLYTSLPSRILCLPLTATPMAAK